MRAVAVVVQQLLRQAVVRVAVVLVQLVQLTEYRELLTRAEVAVAQETAQILLVALAVLVALAL
jgi:hypothetical protein